MLAYIGIFISLFADQIDGELTNVEAISALGILIWGFVGMIFEYLISLGESNATSADKDIKIALGRCPKCLNKISRAATKCPFCTADLI
jgi:hypothetical protein